MSIASEFNERPDGQPILKEQAAPTVTADARPEQSPGTAQAILDERARILARAPVNHAEQADGLELVVFTLSGERYALENDYVREVARLGEITPIAGTRPYFLGVTNYRGEVLVVFDLRVLFGINQVALGAAGRVLILGQERVEFGILAEAVHETVVLPAVQALAPPASLSGVGREYVRGVTQDALIILDGAALLSDSRLYVDEDAPAF